MFGCSIDFLQTATQTYLEDPILDKLQQGMAYTIVFKNCSVILPTQEQLEGCPIHHIPPAVHVPVNPEEIVPEAAFAGVPCLRHVSVESGIRLIGAEAWQNCRQLRIVKLPATVEAFPTTSSVTASESGPSAGSSSTQNRFSNLSHMKKALCSACTHCSLSLQSRRVNRCSTPAECTVACVTELRREQLLTAQHN